MRFALRLPNLSPVAAVGVLKRPSIAKRLALLVGVAFIPAVSITAADFWQRSLELTQKQHAEDLTNLDSLLTKYNGAVERSHLAFFDYVSNRQLDRADTLKTAIGTAATAYQEILLSNGTALISKDLEPLTAFNIKLRDDVDALKKLFETIGAIGSTKDSGLVDALTSAASNVERTLNTLSRANPDSASVQKSLAMALSVRLNETRYLSFSYGVFEGQHAAAYDRLLRSLETLDVDSAEKNKLTEFAKSYQAAFEAWDNAAKDATKRVETIKWSFSSVSPIITKVQSDIAALKKTQDAVVKDVIQRGDFVSLSVFIGSIFLSLLIAVVTARRMSRPLGMITDSMNAIAKGNSNAEVAVVTSQDEIGQMSRALLALREAVKDRETMAKAQLDKAQESTSRNEKFAHSVDAFRKAMSDAAGKLGDAIRALNVSSDDLRGHSNDLSARARSSGEAAEGTRIKATMVAAATEQMSSSGREIVSQIGRSANVASQAADQALETRKALTTLTESTNRVNEVMGLISRIAQQTNLLALNATIEAARAGEAGKGFAVVASEVKQLATETSNAAADISGTISAMGDASTEAMVSFEMLMNGIAELRDAANTIASASHEQEISIASIASTMSSLSEDAQVGAEAASDAERSVHATTDIAMTIDGLSDDFTKIITTLETDVQRFVETIAIAA
jgi:methyl-accepting chemotaxis protein